MGCVMERVPVGNLLIGEDQPLAVIAGLCIIEDEAHTLRMAEALKAITERLPVSFIFKACYDKANRSSVHSFRGPGLEQGLRILEKVKREVGVPVVSDVHTAEECAHAGAVLDMLQVPAFLCRQTDLVVACAETGKPVHVKKGQFMAPLDMSNVVEKITSCGNRKIILTERGSSFGYNNLVCDMRGLALMAGLGFPVCFDATHSAQLPGGQGTHSGGQREFIPLLARAAIAAGVQALFIEVHDDPARAKSDAALVYPLDQLFDLLARLTEIDAVVRPKAYRTRACCV
jgi:2-dehydro-3-deoxyphosphooctonate aldolase (KDO 8-P synthase)